MTVLEKARVSQKGASCELLSPLWQGCVVFKDVAVSFSDEERLLLDDLQRLLYRRTMMEIFVIIVSLGKGVLSAQNCF